MKSKRLRDSFKYAAQGLKAAFIGEKNFRIHCLAMVLVVLCGLLLRLPVVKWVVLFCVIGFVFVCELINTAGETLVDMITKEYSDEAKKVKDLLAGAVLISAAVAVAVGVLIFAEPVIEFILKVVK
ncbi:MAG: diacylglycerol kinase family protein [Clostridiaceae bacterium]|nr:diacylglycerol kinase family protein [Clostridiaceae bacterium]